MTHMKYYSQYGQDAYLNEEVFRGKRDGFFVEVGADDGLTFSNTYFFEKELGWKGICVEPRKKAFAALERNRQCVCENVCVGKENKTERFLEIEGGSDMLSGIYSAYDRRHRKRIREGRTEAERRRVVQMPCRTLSDIFEKNNVWHVDYLSIDTEGNELDILKGIDFEAVKIDCLTVENNYAGSRFRRLKATRVKRFLAKKGFTLLKTIKIDELYRHTGIVRRGFLEELKQIVDGSWLQKLLG